MRTVCYRVVYGDVSVKKIAQTEGGRTITCKAKFQQSAASVRTLCDQAARRNIPTITVSVVRTLGSSLCCCDLMSETV